jgi:hypothetical protein
MGKMDIMPIGCWISLIDTTHKFEKVNNEPLIDRCGFTFDRYQCRYCKMTGRRRGFSGFLEIKEKGLSKECDNAPANARLGYTDKKIMIISKPWAIAPAYNNIFVGGVHTIIDPPPKEIVKNGNAGVWVMGVNNKPIRLLPGEFTIIEEEIMQRSRPVKKEPEMKRTRR